MKDNIFYVLAFNSTSHSIQAEKKIKDKFSILMMPTPRELTNDCGIAIKFLDSNINRIKDFIASMNIPCDLYSMSTEKVQGKRTVEKVFSSTEKGVS